MPVNQSIKLSPRNMLKNTVKDAILMLHGVDLLLVSRTLPKRLGPSGINAMRLVHKNSTGQPWAAPGHDGEETAVGGGRLGA
jgi:hypothetical protein